MRTINIEDIVDANGSKTTGVGIGGFIGVDDLYEFSKYLGEASMVLKDKRLVGELRTLDSRIRVAYFLKQLKDGNKLDPISLQGNMLVDGLHRLRAHFLNGDKEIEYNVS